MSRSWTGSDGWRVAAGLGLGVALVAGAGTGPASASPAPPPPVITSTFPPVGTGSVPVRTYGTFTFTVPVPTNVIKFEYVLNGTLAVRGNKTVRIGSDGSATTPEMASGQWGTNILTAESVARGGAVSQPVNYSFYLTPPAAPDKYGDLNGDGRPDLVSAGSDGYLYFSADGAHGHPARRVRETVVAPDGSPAGWGSALISAGGDYDQSAYQGLAAIWRGNLYLYSGTGLGDFTNEVYVPPPPGVTGWSSVTQLIAAGDLTGNGASDLVVREGNQLLLLAGQGSYQFAAPVPIAGTGWSHLSVVGFADMTADGIPDLIARDTASGTLWLYKGTGTGTFGDATTRVRIGSGFTTAAYPMMITKGDVNRDGTVDLWAVSSTGKLYLFPGNPAGGFGFHELRSSHPYWTGVTALG